MTWNEAAHRRLIRGETKGLAAFAARLGLRILSFPYAVVTALRNVAFDRGWKKRFTASVPVISIGNLTVGGTGKTPMVEHVARRLREHGLRVAILSRGYGATDGPNDEALLLEQNLPDVPHLQGADRSELARIAPEELESESLILDDGFQHRRLARDLDIVLLDATDPFGGGRQLPAGLLRESVRSLRRANLIALTRVDAVDADAVAAIRARIAKIAGNVPLLAVRFEPTLLIGHGGAAAPIEWLKGRRVLAVCGIGNPDGFWQSLVSLGASIVDRRAYADHHPYSREDLADLERWVRQHSPEGVIVTQKDLVKLCVPSIGGSPLWAVRIQARIDEGAEALDDALAKIARAAQVSHETS